MRAELLRVEYLTEPLGIDITRPRFSWTCNGGVTQTAYQIVATRDGVKVWDTGRIESASMTHHQYGGVALRSRDRIQWSVTLWDENALAGPTSSSWFEMGLLNKTDWTATWVTGDYRPKKNSRYPVDYFRRTFTASEDIVKARLYITACGIYQAKINGQRIGDFALAPGSTDYRHRLHYQSYDVLDALSDENALEIQLADGWYRGSIGAFGPTTVFGSTTKLLCQLELTHADGWIETVRSDSSFRWCNDGPERFADLKDGEVIDARMSPSYAGWAREVQEALTPTASNTVIPRQKEVFTPKLLITPKGHTVLDFGQNIAGFISFTVHGTPGQTLQLRLGEILDADGEFTQSNFQLQRPTKKQGRLGEILLVSGKQDKLRGPMQPTPLQQIDFVCSGDPDSYTTAFAVFGFRYALITTTLPIDPSAFRSIAVYSDMGETGSFTSSNDDVNALVENTRWSMKGNFLDVPTDCPTRERLGWTGDAQVFFETAAHLMDVSTFYRKWLLDVRDGQLKSGRPSAVAPFNGLPMLYDSTGGSVGWGDAAVLVPYRHWKRYGDDRLLSDSYPMMRDYARFMIANTGHKDRKAAKANPHNRYVYEKGVQLGEWLEPEEFRDPVGVGVKIRHTEVATAYLHFTMSHMVQIAITLGHTEDAQLFAEYADGAKRAYTNMFLSNGSIDTDRQAKLVRPLALGLVDGEARTAVQNRLVEAVKNRDYRIGTGFLSTPFVLPALTEAGRADIAYRVLENKNQPSWLAQIDAGATTVWEDWEGTLSQNHYSPGAVCQWLFDTVAGIHVDSERHFLLAPTPGGTLTFASSHHESIYGIVRSKWQIAGSRTHFEFQVPTNCTAEILLPDGHRHLVGPGSHSYVTETAAA